MNTKKIILTNQQLYEVLRRVKNSVNEAEQNINISVPTTGNTTAAKIDAVNKNQSQINQASQKGNPIIHADNFAQNGTDDSKAARVVTVATGQDVADAIRTQLPTGVDNAPTVITGPGLQERRSLTKREIEEVRKLNFAALSENSQLFTKKQLDEAFENENMLRSEMMDHMPLKMITDAYVSILGGELEDLTSVRIDDAVIEKYNNATPEQQRKFKKFLCIE